MHAPSLFVGVALSLIGLFMLIWPRRFWLLTEAWRYDNARDVRLSDAYLFWMKLNAIAVMLFGLLLLLQGVGMFQQR